ncbi:uncharacterized protein LOC133195880 [Saccostrea echinata]|uniref:uncharacterized protein LOC133195880 n=1 Tax=Saccostrea echinata TaxID=191078 RepID=UPI002A82B273|nr:uncharacterized protein LOC133195880 [Saccostrea echinata]
MASFDGRYSPEYSNINIPDILNGDSDKEEEYENVVLRPKESTDDDEVFEDTSVTSSPSAEPKKRRSGVIISMENLNKISPPESNDEDEKDNLPRFTLSSFPGSPEERLELTEIDFEDKNTEDHDESKEKEDKVCNLMPNPHSVGVIYDETRPRRISHDSSRYKPSDVIYDETKPKRKVSFDTAMPTLRKIRNDNMPIRKISLDTGLDSKNIRRINIDSAAGRLLKKQCSNPEVKTDRNIGQISFDEESGTLHIRQINPEEDDSSQVMFETDTPCVTPRKMSFEGDPSDIGYINRGFDNDTYLDNVTFQVQRVYPDIQEKDLNGFTKKSNGNCDNMGYETKGILKGSKTRQAPVNGNSDDIEDKHSKLAEHLRKDSIALTSEKLGQILDLQKHYSQQHMREKRFGKQREILKKYRLHLGVSALLVFIIILVSIGWHFHNIARKEKMISQRIFFEANSKRITLSDPSERDSLYGTLGHQIPSWQKPTHCLGEVETQEFQCLRWKNSAILRISYFSPPEMKCYNISWESISAELYPLDCYNIGNQAWFGPSNQTHPEWPITRDTEFTFSASYSQNFDAGTFNSAVENYWLSENGNGLLVSDNIPLVMLWNTMNKGSWCITSNYTGDFYGFKANIDKKRFLNYTICNGNDPKSAHKYFRSNLEPGPSSLPTKLLYTSPLWSTKGDRDSKTVSEVDVLSIANNVRKHNILCGSIVVDGLWEDIQGDFTFDEQRFPNISTLQSTVSSTADCSLTVSFNPYFDYKSDSFTEGHPKDHFILDASGRVPALVQWNDDVMAMLDVTNPAAKSWITGKMMTLADRYKIKSFKMTYGKPTWLPFHPTFHKPDVTPNQLKKEFTHMLVSFHQLNADIIEGTSHTQNLPYFVSVRTKVQQTENGLCLTGTIPVGLALGLMGYPYVMADGISYKKYDPEDKTYELLPRDLYVRWIQMATFFPGMKYSTPPWKYDSDLVNFARKAAQRHKQYVSPAIEAMMEDIKAGMPIIRPVWWIDPMDKIAKSVGDSFLIGDNYLIAPVLCEGKTSREIYFPDGIWKDLETNKLIVGKKWITYPVEMTTLPIFEKTKVYGGT